MQTLILDAAGREFVKRVMKLYSSAHTSSAKGKIADMLLENAVEAGRLTAEVSDCFNAEEKRAAATAALEALNKTTFLLEVAEETAVFVPRRIKPVSDLAAEINTALLYYIYGRSGKSGNARVADSDGFNDDYIG